MCCVTCEASDTKDECVATEDSISKLKQDVR
jgi:hypothetical protein